MKQYRASILSTDAAGEKISTIIIIIIMPLPVQTQWHARKKQKRIKKVKQKTTKKKLANRK